ncbi:DUF3105 domain-containing protein [Deinococcus ruber]|uniref:DUF3105 domain-containing protein n=1 Tax=Deinococcus ruber TaxID=1848197 RepID=A0A918CGA2_9DEIO|nr:DUF3105 domain-containing protein [Deinococcus ruber]GGR20584.1 hypothetical protein GCM10008957_36170 [Deinococcus ruber]
MKRLLCLAIAAPLLLAACSKNSTDASGVQIFKYASGIHQEGQITYKEHPPVGGPHNPRWQQCGIYTQPLYDQYAVHSMEHGAVWITYKPGTSAADIAKLTAAVQGRSYILMSPYENQPAPIMASAWNAQLTLKSADDPALKDFLAKYEQGESAPERGAACDGPYATTTTQ